MNAGTVAAFLAVDLLLILTPDADWAYAITAGLRDRSVLPAVAGLVAGYAGHTLLVVAGLGALVTTTPSLLTALTVLGAAYLVWLGGSVLARPTGPSADPTAGTPSARRVALRGAGISSLNFKGWLLYLVLLPQFVHHDASWPVAAQTSLLGSLHMANCAAVYFAVGTLARTVLQVRPRAARAVTRTAGAMMIVIGGYSCSNASPHRS
jgi:threonine/homoserine/homoserine lactone efflux protein